MLGRSTARTDLVATEDPLKLYQENVRNVGQLEVSGRGPVGGWRLWIRNFREGEPGGRPGQYKRIKGSVLIAWQPVAGKGESKIQPWLRGART